MKLVKPIKFTSECGAFSSDEHILHKVTSHVNDIQASKYYHFKSSFKCPCCDNHITIDIKENIEEL